MASSNVPWAPLLTRFPTLFPPQTGVPGTGHTRGLRLDPNGIVLWVDPNHVDANDNRDGTEPDSPLRTVAAALARCRAYMNDTIVVSPSSYWTYGNPAVGRATPIAEEVTVATPGVRIVGLMPSSSLGVPWVVTQNNGVAITVNAMDTLVEGFNFWEPTYTGATGILAQWDGPPWGESVVIRNCFFGYGLAYGIRLDYSWNALIHDNLFQECLTAAINSVDTYGDPDYAVIRDNLFVDNVAAIDLEDVSECTIYRNAIRGDAAGTNNFIDLTGGSENFVFDNWLGCTLAAGQYNTTCSDATSGLWVRNHCIDGETGAAPT